MKGVRILWTLALSLLILNIPIIGVDAEPDICMYIDPECITGTVGSHFTVNIMCENVPSNPPIYYGCWAWQANVTWDPTVLTVAADWDPVFMVWIPRLTWGNFFIDQPGGVGTSKKIDYEDGWFMFAQTTKENPTPPPYAHGVPGSGWLASVEFEVVSEGYSVIDISSNYWDVVNPPPYPPTCMLDDSLNDFDLTVSDAYFGVPPDPWQSDINEDGRIDIRDLAMVAVHFGEGPDYVGREDCSGETTGVKDGYVDIYDLSYVALDYGTQYYP